MERRGGGQAATPSCPMGWEGQESGEDLRGEGSCGVGGNHAEENRSSAGGGWTTEKLLTGICAGAAAAAGCGWHLVAKHTEDPRENPRESRSEAGDDKKDFHFLKRMDGCAEHANRTHLRICMSSPFCHGSIVNRESRSCPMRKI